MQVENHTSIRLQKFLAQAGIASRRKAEDLILAGHVAVNGVTTTRLGTTVDPSTDTIAVDGKKLDPPNRTITYLLHKPAGLICSASDIQGNTIFSLFPQKAGTRLFSVGRLDKYSEGLLLVTNNGDLAHQLTHPRYGHTKTYDVTVNGTVSREQLHQLRSPIIMDGYQTRGVKVQIERTTSETTTLRMILKEGRSRQIRNMCAAQNLAIRKLQRIRIGHLELGNLKPGSYRPLNKADLARLQKTDTILQPRKSRPNTSRHISGSVDPVDAKGLHRHRSNDYGKGQAGLKSRGLHRGAHAKPATQPAEAAQSGARNREQEND